MEVKDLLILKSRNPALELDDSEYSVSTRTSDELATDFLKGAPFAYLLGISEFYGREFYVNKHVLIPRPETELLVEKIIQSQKLAYSKVLDVGVGSGVILLSLLSMGAAANGVGVDVSGEALKVARTNAKRLGLESKCEFILTDRLHGIEEKFDLIVSNPPYIKNDAHKELVHQKVDEFEPSLALYLNDNEYESWFKVLFSQVLSSLSKGGTFMMEGHENELHKQANQLRNLGFVEVQVLQDFAERDRFLYAKSAV
jgi:release factor glutamine methyltransferase